MKHCVRFWFMNSALTGANSGEQDTKQVSLSQDVHQHDNTESSPDYKEVFYKYASRHLAGPIGLQLLIKSGLQELLNKVFPEEGHSSKHHTWRINFTNCCQNILRFRQAGLLKTLILPTSRSSTRQQTLSNGVIQW